MQRMTDRDSLLEVLQACEQDMRQLALQQHLRQNDPSAEDSTP